MKRRFLIPGTAGVVLLLVLFGLGGVWWVRQSHQVSYRLPPQPLIAVPEGKGNSYATNFATAENPISEKGKWTSGKAVGFDWSDVATQVGLAHGTEPGTGRGSKSYDDSVALLTGSWQPDQTVVATVYTTRQNRRVFEEVELRLRSTLSAHSSTGYEVLFRCLKTKDAYASIVRWDGPLGKFVYLSQKEGLQYGLADGDQIKATVTGNVITAYINGVELLRATDDTYASGSPGIGFWLKRPSGLSSWLQAGVNYNVDYGFTSFAAWDLPSKSEVKREERQSDRERTLHGLMSQTKWQGQVITVSKTGE